ncbi:HAD family hydrolase [Arthrobacter sp. MA-N2]|uniref:HAD family hydrolase n=1 Tax=Arthrobacter sp. MA-N2 TaxID=1101188 RepID=UPI00048575A9|nr:HAD family phosphatase [Arthrobacter sp. MA-N2]
MTEPGGLGTADYSAARARGRAAAALLFDLDGLLIDSEDACFEAAKTVLARHSGLTLPTAWYGAQVGKSAEETYDSLRTEFRLRPRLQELLAERYEILARWYAEPTVLPGAEALILEAVRGGKLLGVVSSSPQPLVEAALGALAFGGCFHTVVTADHAMVARPKPFPDPYRTACKLLDLDPAEALAFEDSSSGATAAVLAGIPTVAVPNRWTVGQAFPDAVLKVPTLLHLLPDRD